MSSEYNRAEEIQVSVVMPVYHAEEFLEESLKDVLQQTLKKIEVICVNDGSTDRSAEIIRKFMKKDKRLHLIEQEHISAGAARNRGIKAAKGKYLICWDADDRFHKDALEEMYQKLEEMQADICVCRARKFDENGDMGETDAYLKMDMLPEKNPFNKFDNPKYIFNFATNVPWNKMYRRSFVQKNGLQYQNIRQANDTFFTIKALYCAERITYVDKELIWYRVNNQNSLTGNASKMRLCIYEAYAYTHAELRGLEYYDMVKNSFRNKVLSNFYYALNIQTEFEVYQELYQTIRKDGLRLFELDEAAPEDIYQEWQYRDLQRLKTMAPGDFLLRKSYERIMDNDRVKRERKELRELLHKERTAGISYKIWRNLRELYRRTIGKKH